MDDHDGVTRETKRIMRNALRLRLQVEQSSRRMDRLGAVVLGLVMVIFAWQRQWVVLAFCAWAALWCLVLLPRLQRSSRAAGWLMAWPLAYKIAERHGASDEQLTEMFFAGQLGLPSEGAELDKARLLLRELEEELGDDEL